MQMNQALFMSSGQCGYVLQPPNMRDDLFDPFDKSTLRGVELISVSIEVSAGLLSDYCLVTCSPCKDWLSLSGYLGPAIPYLVSIKPCCWMTEVFLGGKRRDGCIQHF